MTYAVTLASRWNRESPWNALWAMMIGFFMIMFDATIVAIANPIIMAELRIGYDAVIWVTSSYLLGYAVVLLVAGRLGDRLGTKNLYLIGLVTFTCASLWCGLSGSAAMLIAARVVQGVGAGVLTPQTLSTITRIFPPERHGAAMSVWGATAGVASLVGPLAGGVLVDSLGWEWIFFINVPIGFVGVALAVWLVPAWIQLRPTRAHRFDLPGVGLSGAGVFAIVFGLQQGQSAGWAPWIIDSVPPLPVLGFGFSMLAIGLTWLSFEMVPDTPIWRLALAFGAIGVGMAFIWAPLTATATRNLPPHLAGASSGVYNTTRQLGAVLGSSGMAAFMTARIGAEVPRGARRPAGASALTMPEFLREPFSAAMSQAILLPAFIALLGIIAALFLVGFTESARTRDGVPDQRHEYDDDDYVEYLLRREPDVGEAQSDPDLVEPISGHRMF